MWTVVTSHVMAFATLVTFQLSTSVKEVTTLNTPSDTLLGPSHQFQKTPIQRPHTPHDQINFRRFVSLLCSLWEKVRHLEKVHYQLVKPTEQENCKSAHVETFNNTCCKEK